MNRSRDSQKDGNGGGEKLKPDAFVAAPDAPSLDNYSNINLPSGDRFSVFGNRMSPVPLGELSSGRHLRYEPHPATSLDEVITTHFPVTTGVGLGTLLSVERPQVRKLNLHEALAVAFKGASGSSSDFVWASSLLTGTFAPVRHVLEVLNLTSGLEETRELAVPSLLRLRHPNLVELFTLSVASETSAPLIERTLLAAFALSDEAVTQVWKSAQSNPAAQDVKDPIERFRNYTAPVAAGDSRNPQPHGNDQLHTTLQRHGAMTQEEPGKKQPYWQFPELSLLALQLNLAGSQAAFDEKAGEIQRKFPEVSVPTFAAVANSQGSFERVWMLDFFALHDALSKFLPLLKMLPRTEYVDSVVEF